MKKLTAGIFSVIVGLVSVNAADAAVASQGYVDAKVGANTTKITELSTTVATNATNAAAATKEVADDLSAYQTSNDAAVAALQAKDTSLQADINARKVKTVSGENLVLDENGNLTLTGLATDGAFTTLSGTVAEHTAALETLNADSTNVNSVAGKIAAAINSEVSRADGLYATQTALNELTTTVGTKAAQADLDALGTRVGTNETAIGNINTTIGTVAEGKTVVGLIDEAKQAASSANSGLETRVKAIEDDNYTQSEFDAFNTTNTAAIAAAKSEAIADAKTETTTQVNALANGAVATNAADIATIKEQQTAQDALIQANTNNFASYSTTEQMNAAIKAGDDAVNATIGTVETGKTVVQMIADAQSAATYDDEEVKADISALEAADEAQDVEIGNRIPKPAAECSSAKNYCVLTYNNTGYYWEVIARENGETLPDGTTYTPAP